MNFTQIGEYLFCRIVDFEQWLYYLFNGGAPRRLVSDPKEEILPHRRMGKVIWNFVEDHGISGMLFFGVVSFIFFISLWIEGGSPSERIRKAKGSFKFLEITLWYIGFPTIIILFIWGIFIQIGFFINGYFW